MGSYIEHNLWLNKTVLITTTKVNYLNRNSTSISKCINISDHGPYPS